MLNGKVAIVTGGASGIGKSIAKSYLDHGAKVLIMDVNDEGLKETLKELTKFKGKVLSINGDVTRVKDIRKAIREAILNWKRIDVLVNNAGVGTISSLIEMSEEEWDFVLNVNLKGMFLFTREIAKIMIKQNEGCIINISSINEEIPYSSGND